MRGYPICRVPIVPPGPTSRKVENLQVGPKSSFPAYSFLNMTLIETAT
jgi:hypothetical protein